MIRLYNQNFTIIEVEWDRYWSDVLLISLENEEKKLKDFKKSTLNEL